MNLGAISLRRNYFFFFAAFFLAAGFFAAFFLAAIAHTSFAFDTTRVVKLLARIPILHQCTKSFNCCGHM